MRLSINYGSSFGLEVFADDLSYDPDRIVPVVTPCSGFDFPECEQAEFERQESDVQLFGPIRFREPHRFVPRGLPIPSHFSLHFSHPRNRPVAHRGGTRAWFNPDSKDPVMRALTSVFLVMLKRADTSDPLSRRIAGTLLVGLHALFVSLPQKTFRGASVFFQRLRAIDVDRVGTEIFRHCTSPRALYVTLFERWWVVFLFACAGIAIGIVTIKTAQESYETRGSLLIYQKLPTFMDDVVMLPDPKSYDALFATHVNLIGSQMIVEQAIESHRLHDRCPEIFEQLEEDETFEDYVREHLAISRAGSGDSTGAFVVTVGFGHTEKAECPLVVDAVLNTYREHVNSSLLFDQQKASQLVAKNVDQLRNEMNQSNRTWREFLKTAPGIWNRYTGNNPYQERVESLENELTELKSRRVSLRSRHSIMIQETDRDTGRPLSDFERLALIDQEHVNRLEMLVRVREKHINIDAQADYPGIQELESAKFDKLLLLRADRAEMSRNVGSVHPALADIDAQIAEIETAIDSTTAQTRAQTNISPGELVQSYVRMLVNELEDTQQKIEFVEEEIASAVSSAQELTDFTVKASHFQNQYEQSLERFQVAADKAAKESMLSEFGNFVAEIVARPDRCEMTWPKKPVILALCTILGIFAGSFVSISLDLIAYTPLRRAFPFLPGWVLGGRSYEQRLQEEDRERNGQEDRDAGRVEAQDVRRGDRLSSNPSAQGSDDA